MRTLTAAEVSKEVEDIRTRRWPLGNVLFVKNLYRQESGMIRKDKDKPPAVTVFRLHGSDPDPKYETLEAMVEAGWVVD